MVSAFPEELLRINDDLNNVFLRYDRFERLRSGQAGDAAGTEAPPAVSYSPVWTYRDIPTVYATLHKIHTVTVHSIYVCTL